MVANFIGYYEIPLFYSYLNLTALVAVSKLSQLQRLLNSVIHCKALK